MQSILRCWFAALALVVLLPSMSWADDPALAKPTNSEAAEQLTQGNKLYNVRKFEDAAKAYVAGRLIEPAPVFDYNLGQCYRQAGRYEDAIWHYKLFITRGQPGTELRRFVDDFIAQMEAELAKKAATQPPTEPGGTGTERKPIGDANAQPPSPSNETESAELSYVETPSPFTDKRKLALGAWSVGVVGVGLGVGFELSARSKYDDAKVETASQQRRDDLEGAANTRRRVGVIAGTVGVVAIAAGTFLWLTGKPNETAIAVAPHVERDGAGLVFAGRF